MESLTKSVIVMASGSGTTFEALALGLKGSQIQIKALIASKDGIGAIEKSKTLGIPAMVQTENIISQITEINPDLIVLAGYLKKLPTEFIDKFEGKIINVHPSLLPKYGGKGMYGRHVHEAVKAAGDTESGATVHIVTENYDEGPILGQVKVQISAEDDVSSIEVKVRSIEKELLLSSVLKFFSKDSD